LTQILSHCEGANAVNKELEGKEESPKRFLDLQDEVLDPKHHHC